MAAVPALVPTLPRRRGRGAPGGLDATCSGDGKVLAGIAYDDLADEVEVQPDGKIVSVGASVDEPLAESRFGLTRHSADGAPDPFLRAARSAPPTLSQRPTGSPAPRSPAVRPCGRGALIERGTSRSRM
ncbi:hypothetical protein QA802_39880 [Streptomyces sp. B21-105]|uniref:hypothetical protein n=1 Tax=Streptomyces sp. B21-105 TaxID=3039417 RepID=UPI002FF26A31